MSSPITKPKMPAKKDPISTFKPEKPFSDQDWLAVFLQCVMKTGVKVDIAKVATTMGVTPVHANVQFLRLRKRFGFTHLVGSNRRGKAPTKAEDKDEHEEVGKKENLFGESLDYDLLCEDDV